MAKNGTTATSLFPWLNQSANKCCSDTVKVKESITIPWPQRDRCKPVHGSTQELVMDGHCHLWVSGPAFDYIAKISADDGTATFFDMGVGSMPHGLTIDKGGHLWVGLQSSGELVQINVKTGEILARVNVKIHIHKESGDQVINTQPHGVGLAADGSVWFTGKQTNSVGRIDYYDGEWHVKHFPLQRGNATPVYIAADTDWRDYNKKMKDQTFMWCTEFSGNAIARISLDGVVKEFPIPTANSGPVTITKAPQGKAMWFTQEKGGKIGRIDMDGKITEFPIPSAERQAVQSALAFDPSHNFWVQLYVNPPKYDNEDTGNDYLVKLGYTLDSATSNDISDVPVTFYKTPSKRTVMHRIIQASDEIWFTELKLDKIGYIDLSADDE